MDNAAALPVLPPAFLVMTYLSPVDVLLLFFVGH
jgi:hypothetical protein